MQYHESPPSLNARLHTRDYDRDYDRDYHYHYSRGHDGHESVDNDADSDGVRSRRSSLAGTSMADCDDADNMPAGFEYEGETDELPPTQIATQPVEDDETIAQRSTIWGYLEPFNKELPRLELSKSKTKYRLGRAPLPWNDIVLTDPRASRYQCIIVWDGKEDESSTVEVHDLASNGTFINGKIIGNPNYHGLRDGDVLAFASPNRPQRDTADPGHQDNRYTYHHTASLMSVSMTSGKK